MVALEVWEGLKPGFYGIGIGTTILALEFSSVVQWFQGQAACIAQNHM